jgi:hypothetical protein
MGSTPHHEMLGRAPRCPKRGLVESTSAPGDTVSSVTTGTPLAEAILLGRVLATHVKHPGQFHCMYARDDVPFERASCAT